MLRLFIVLILISTHEAFAQDTLIVEKPPLVITKKVYVVDPQASSQQGLVCFIAPLWNTHQDTEQLSWRSGWQAGMRYEHGWQRLKVAIGMSFGQLNIRQETPNDQFMSNITQKVVVDTIASPFQVVNGDTTWYHDTVHRTVYTEEGQWQRHYEIANGTIYYLEVPLLAEWLWQKGKWEYGTGVHFRSRFYFASATRFPVPNLHLLTGLQLPVRYLWTRHVAVWARPTYSISIAPSTPSFEQRYLSFEIGTSFSW